MEVKYAKMSVEYVDHMGSDVNVVNAARVSFAKRISEIDEDKDVKLINYLAKHNHWSPFAHTSISLRIKAPIFIARQYVKHCVGFSWNEESRRYIDDEPEFYMPEVWREKPSSVKQGSAGPHQEQNPQISDGVSFTFGPKEICRDSLMLYKHMIEQGYAPEQARMILPQNTMTNWIWTGSLVGYARVCKLRLDNHAQKEAQELAQKIKDVVSPLYPISWEALMKYTNV